MTRLQAAAKGAWPLYSKSPPQAIATKSNKPGTKAMENALLAGIRSYEARAMEDRAKLASQLVRCHGLLWSIEDVKGKAAIRERIRQLEIRIAEIDGLLTAPSVRAPLIMSRPGRQA
jgi:hypothetical protein